MRRKTPDAPMRVMFLVTSMPVGGAETLLVNLVREMNRQKFSPEVVCLKDRGPLGEELSSELPVHSNLISNKFDVLVLWRLWRLMRARHIDAVITVGAGDKMFWGRLAAKLAGVPVVVSALHSTGWPDSVGKMNRLLTPLTDAFVGVADAHAKHLIEYERFPADKVHVIYNGIDTARFCPGDKNAIRAELGVPLDAKVIAILAALRPEKNHELFLEGAARILQVCPDARFLVIGDGPLRPRLEELAKRLNVAGATHFLGSRSDVERVLQGVDVLALTSHNEASPVSILEALSSGVPAIAADVGSVKETVIDGITGRLFPVNSRECYVKAMVELLNSEPLRLQMGANGRKAVVENRSLANMVRGYESLLERLFTAKSRTAIPAAAAKLRALVRPHDSSASHNS